MSLPPDPPLPIAIGTTTSLNLFLKIYCPNNNGIILLAIHNEHIVTAIQAIRAAKRMGVDCIKKAFAAETMTLDLIKSYFKTSQYRLWDRPYLHDLYLGKAFSNKDYILLSRVSSLQFYI